MSEPTTECGFWCMLIATAGAALLAFPWVLWAVYGIVNFIKEDKGRREVLRYWKERKKNA